MVDYNKRLVEVDEVLSYLSEENINKIPEEIRSLIKENKDKDYVWKFDETKELKDQGLNRDTIIILSYLNMEYLLNEEQKKLMEQIHDLNEKKQEEIRKEKYNPENLFKKTKDVNCENTENNQMIVVKENIFTKIINKLRKFFVRNK